MMGLLRDRDPTFSYECRNEDNPVLFFTIHDAQYPINVDIMTTICSPFGNVLRIVIFRKNGVQAMVEYVGVI
jgi:heterogeneous nuclear ribonucleoprotein L